MRHCDVLAVGGGGAGTAVVAADSGCSGDRIGGGKPPGWVDRMFDHYMTFDRWNLEPG